MGTFLDREIDMNRSGGYLYGGAGSAIGIIDNASNQETIKAIINDLISRSQLSIPIHDHTAPNKGGDCYAGLGAKLI